LIIFFMLTTSFSPERTNVTLPFSKIQDRVTEGAAIVAITELGEISFTTGEEESVLVDSLQELGTLVEALVQASPSWEFLIKSDRNVPTSEHCDQPDEHVLLCFIREWTRIRRSGVKRFIRAAQEPAAT